LVEEKVGESERERERESIHKKCQKILVPRKIRLCLKTKMCEDGSREKAKR
jgi:hypothetical protein